MLLVCGTALACLSEDDLPMIVPSEPAAVTVSPSLATLDHLGDTAVFTARITDQRGESYPGTVAWASSDEAIFTVDGGGVVTATGNGTGLLSASFEGVSGTATVSVRQLADALEVVSGGGQEGQPGRPLPEPVAVQVLDAGGSAVAGASVAFQPAFGHGSVDPGTSVSNDIGVASTMWTLGDSAGVQTLVAQAAERVSVDVNALAGEVEPPSDTAIYRVTFNATWSATTHPADFPSGAHFSPLIGAVHNDGASFWESGATASPGIEQMAETGATALLAGEIRAEMPNHAIAFVTGQGIGSPARTTISEVVLTLDHPLVTLVTMIAPSPDWFVGVAGQSLQDEFGLWADELLVVLFPYDAGTDDGASYRSPNADSSPKQPIRSLRGVRPFSDEPIGTFRFERIAPAVR